ncbi:MAG: ribonuclease P protein component [Steroidobacteraceae bacterium]
MSRGAGLERLGFPPGRRLRRKVDFDAAYATGRRFGDAFFGVVARANGGDGPRLGLAVATRIAGSSVARNRIRRVIRETFRVRQHRLPAVDVVVSARARAHGAGNAELRASLDTLWSRLIDSCASLPKS